MGKNVAQRFVWMTICPTTIINGLLCCHLWTFINISNGNTSSLVETWWDTKWLRRIRIRNFWYFVKITATKCVPFSVFLKSIYSLGFHPFAVISSLHLSKNTRHLSSVESMLIFVGLQRTHQIYINFIIIPRSDWCVFITHNMSSLLCVNPGVHQVWTILIHKLYRHLACAGRRQMR